ncbi:translocation/assembly module TamB domain-containing protein [Pelagicoccus sp. SDUM812002]|uniref:translocation/assembly module TamB domain-containing protein n=1 Tax=Pelagicoccus sp. SDUM812002 TaxID=3041266 RepID=UPI00280D13C8|nr:translocation/assembly module TamB domain-containing protein [Pelagicoccus sp. SDUM812002]MDQ8186631.1 translocation/assembly module TamB domain-containing protein [Pelagicoccus sp. SDUM812002]
MPKSNPPEKRPRFRKTKRSLALLAGILLLCVLSFPFWSTWIAQPLAAKFGVNIGSVERLSWDRWQLDDLSTDQAGINFTAQTAELPSPTKLLFEHFSSDPATEKLVVETWKLDVSNVAPEEPQETQEPLTLPQIFVIANDSLARLAGYLSGVTLLNGTLSVESEDTLELPSLTLTPQQLDVALRHIQSDTEATLEARFESPALWQISAAVPEQNLTLEVELKNENDQPTLTGVLENHQNAINLQASWARSLIPESARLEASAFELDERYPFWGSAPPLNIDLRADWTGQAFTYRIEAFDTSDLEGTSNILLAGNGSPKSLEIKTAKVDLPWLTVESDKPILLDFSLDNPLEAAQLDAKLDLAKLPFIEATGKLDAVLKTRTSPDGLPVLMAEIQGANITLWDTLLESATANVDLLGQEATIRTLEIRSAAGSRINLTGGYNIQEQQFLESNLQLQLENESQRLRDLLPSIEWQTVNGDLQLVGPLADPEFQGNLSFATLKLPSTNSFSLETEVAGRLSDLEATVQASTGIEDLDVSLGIQRSSSESTVSISKLALTDSDGAVILSLEETGTVTLDASAASVASSGIILTGPNGQQLELSSLLLTDSQFSLHATAIDFQTNIFNNWLAVPIPTLRIQDFDTEATLSESESKITTSGSASWQLKEGSSVDLSWLAQSDPTRLDSLSIDHLEIGADSKHILVAEGHFPVSVNWSQGTAQTKIHQDAPLEFSLESSPHPDFWASLETILPIALKRPIIKAQLSGSLNDPKGNFDVKLASLRWSHPEDPSKSVQLQDLSASLLADSDGLAIRSLEAHAGKNAVYADAKLPIGKTSLYDLVRDTQLLDFSPLTGKARVEILDLEVLKSWLPPLLRYEGTASADIQLREGDISAVANIENLATRPLPPLGSLSKISGQVELSQGVWRVNEIRGLAEKSTFTLRGSADLNDTSNPIYDLKFSSKEFPLIRDDGLLFSGDIDMQLVSKNQESPLLKGSLKLTKGLFLVEPDLLAGSTKTVSSRPPYFAVDQAPFNDWGLDINILGDEFLRVSNSFFEGTLSAEFDLEGTLGAPLLIGKAETNTGRIFFPASSLTLENGQVLITRDRPSELQLEAVAGGRIFAYDINLEVGGTVTDPELVITSNPALTQVDALLLLTTGALPDAQGNLAQKSATSLGLFIGKGLFKKLTGGNSESASKLSLEVGQDISLQGKRTIDASYQLSEDLEIEGEYDKRDEFNANLKWTIFER